MGFLAAALCAELLPSASATAQVPVDSLRADATPSAAGERLELGRQAMARRAFAEAREHFFRVLQLDWNNPQVYAWWCAAKDSVAQQMQRLTAVGDRRMASGRYADAMISYYEALIQDSTRAGVRDKFSLAQRKAEARRCLAAALESFLRGDYASARAMVDSARGLDPRDSMAVLFAERLQASDQHAEGREGLRTDTEAWAWHVEALKSYRAGDYRAAIGLWEKILAKYPGHPDAMANIRQARLRLKADGPRAGDVAAGDK